MMQPGSVKWLDFETIQAISITFGKKKKKNGTSCFYFCGFKFNFLFSEPGVKAASTQSLTDINKLIKVSGVTQWVRARQHTNTHTLKGTQHASINRENLQWRIPKILLCEQHVWAAFCTETAEKRTYTPLDRTHTYTHSVYTHSVYVCVCVGIDCAVLLTSLSVDLQNQWDELLKRARLREAETRRKPSTARTGFNAGFVSTLEQTFHWTASTHINSTLRELLNLCLRYKL